MSLWWEGHGVRLYHGDALEVLGGLSDGSVDAVVTDPPYGLEFMGKEWDGAGGFRRTLNAADVGRDNAFGRASRTSPEYRAGHLFQDWCQLWATEALRVLKPGGHMLAFGGTRTWHRLACAVEDAGFEIRDSIAWMYGSGFPKSLDVSKAIDRRRHDGGQIRQVTAWVAAARTEARVTNADIDAAFGFNGMAGHWTTQGAQAAVPTIDQIPRLLDVLKVAPDDVPADIQTLILDLNGMKGQPGPAWFDRVVTGSRVVPDASKVRPHFAGATYQDGYASKAVDLTAPATDAARTWQGWGTALKPAFEPIVAARKPLAGTVAGNVLEWGTGALNIDGCRIEHASEVDLATSQAKNPGRADTVTSGVYGAGRPQQSVNAAGRWPANVVLDESQADALDQQSGDGISRAGSPRRAADSGDGWGMTATGAEYDDQGGASRFFYVAKADSSERPRINGTAHPTVKPLALMRWLVRLVTPPGGTVLDPFAGSGTTVEACILEGFACIAIEREADYLPLIEQRINRQRSPVAAVAQQRNDDDDADLFTLLGDDTP